MQPSIPWSNSGSVFVIERTAIIHSLKCTVPFSLVVALPSLLAICCHSLSLFVLLIVTLYHLLHHSLLLVVICCHLLYHSLLPVAIGCPSLSLDVPLVCLFINDHLYQFIFITNIPKTHFFLLCTGYNRTTKIGATYWSKSCVVYIIQQ